MTDFWYLYCLASPEFHWEKDRCDSVSAMIINYRTSNKPASQTKLPNIYIIRLAFIYFLSLIPFDISLLFCLLIKDVGTSVGSSTNSCLILTKNSPSTSHGTIRLLRTLWTVYWYLSWSGLNGGAIFIIQFSFLFTEKSIYREWMCVRETK